MKIHADLLRPLQAHTACRVTIKKSSPVYDYALKGEISFIKGRLKFVGAESSAPFPSIIVVFRGDK